MIDINCDMGEGMLNDAALMPFITSANIACGFHAGDVETMQKTMHLAHFNGVKIGAHPSFKDRENFGRIPQELTENEIYQITFEQVNLALSIARHNNLKLHHVKPHGALYNMAANRITIAKAICDAIKTIDASLTVYGLSGSSFLDIVEKAGLKSFHEVFADRTYQADGSLTPRTKANAVLNTEEDVLKQVLQMIKQHRVTATDGSHINIKTDTICIHSDGPHATEFAKLLHSVIF